MSEEQLDELPEEEEQKSVYELLGTDSTMEQQGIVLDLGMAGRYKIARAGGSNQKFNQVFTKKYRPYAKQQRTNTMPEAVAKKLLIEIYAETVVKNWEGVLGRDRKPLPFSRENCIKLLTDINDLFIQIRNASEDATLFRELEIEEAAGN